jgi:hypothetical protein
VFQIRLFSLVREFTARTVTILTWGRLRDGYSVAQAITAESLNMTEENPGFLLGIIHLN